MFYYFVLYLMVHKAQEYPNRVPAYDPKPAAISTRAFFTFLKDLKYFI